MHIFHLTATVKTETALTAKQASHLVELLVSIGQADAQATIEDAGNSDPSIVKSARLVANLSIEDVDCRLVNTKSCDECGLEVDEAVICPDGAEICQGCFDSGLH